MKILAIETATAVCGIAYLDSDGICEKLEKNTPKTHASSLPDFYKKLQQIVMFDLKDLSGIAVSIGPGSFTGLRIGLSFCKGLAYSHNLPIIPVPTLESVASTVRCTQDYTVLLFSHRDMLFCQSYSSDNTPLTQAEVHSWDTVKKIIDDKICYHINCHRFVEERENTFEITPSAEFVGKLALKNYDRWMIKNPFTLVPDYIAPFEMNVRL